MTSRKTVENLGEFRLIDRIRSRTEWASPRVLCGIGDDVAVLRTDPEKLLLVTCDCQVEDIHFLARKITPRQLGWRAGAVNLSDMAAMGGTPLWALVSLMLPPKLPVRYVDELMEGLRAVLEEWDAGIVGGNTASHPDRLVVDVTLLGEGAPGRILMRAGARPGDVLMVTGTLGASRAGLAVLRGEVDFRDEEMRRRAEDRHLTPRPRIREGRILARSGAVHAMLDVSDGLLADLSHLCQAGGVGAVVDAATLPVDPSCTAVASAAGLDPIRWALTGGEDYELLFAVEAGRAEEIRRMVEDAAGTRCTPVGRIEPEESGLRIVWPDGTEQTADGTGGWDHFDRI